MGSGRYTYDHEVWYFKRMYKVTRTVAGVDWLSLIILGAELMRQ